MVNNNLSGQEGTYIEKGNIQGYSFVLTVVYILLLLSDLLASSISKCSA